MLAALPFPTRQGTQVAIDALAQSLARRGHDVRLYTYGPATQSLARDYEHVAVGASHVGERSGPSWARVAADLRLGRGVWSELRREPPDILHAHHFEALPLGLALRRAIGCPLVYHAHSALGPELPTYLHGLRRAMIPAARLVGIAFDRLLPRRADAVVVFDAPQAGLYERLGVARERLRVIPVGIERVVGSGAAARRLSELRWVLGDGPVVLYAGNPDAYQNLPLLGRAVTTLRRDLPTLKLLVLSTYPPALFAAPWRSLGLDGAWVHWPHRDDDDFVAAHGVAGLGVVPRTLSVGAPVKLVNYLAAGLPVVACGAAASLLDATAGVVVEPTPEAFATGIRGALAARERLHDGAMRLGQRYLADALVPSYEHLYADLMS